MELALHVIELKKSQMINNNKEKSYGDYKVKIEKLMKEKELVYKNEEKTIEKVLTEYLQDVKD